MKFPVRSIAPGLSCLIVCFLPACREQEAKISELKDSISSLRDANHAGATELQKLNQQAAVLKQQLSSEVSKRRDVDSKLEKSSATERHLVQYRAELEESLKTFEASVSNYKKQYLP